MRALAATGPQLHSSYLSDSLVAIAVLQGLIIVLYLVQASWSSSLPISKNSFRRTRRVLAAWKLSPAKKAHIFGQSDAAVLELHKSSIEEFRRRRSDALVVGSLGLAAWSALTAQNGPIKGTTLNLLLIGVVSNLAGPSLFRTGPSEGTLMGLSAALTIGYSAIVFAVLSALAVSVKLGWVDLVVEAAGPLLVAVELSQVRFEQRRVTSFLRRAVGAAAASSVAAAVAEAATGAVVPAGAGAGGAVVPAGAGEAGMPGAAASETPAGDREEPEPSGSVS